MVRWEAFPQLHIPLYSRSSQKTYLSARLQCVCVGDEISSLAPIWRGIIQGSILGSVFFSLFHNDLQEVSMFSRGASARTFHHENQSRKITKKLSWPDISMRKNQKNLEKVTKIRKNHANHKKSRKSRKS
jgi:hypothetical protein